MPRTLLRDKNILIVEDEMLIALEISSILNKFQCQTVGPAPSIDEAKRLIQSTKIDGAVLDVNLNGQLISPVVKELNDRDIKFVLLTGYESLELPPELLNNPTVQKPFASEALVRTLVKVFSE